MSRFELPEGVDRRLHALLDKQDGGDDLSEDERVEAEGLVELADFGPGSVAGLGHRPGHDDLTPRHVLPRRLKPRATTTKPRLRGAVAGVGAASRSHGLSPRRAPLPIGELAAHCEARQTREGGAWWWLPAASAAGATGVASWLCP